MSRSRAWTFTINGSHEYAEIKGCCYSVQGKETAKTGTKHIQGYCYFSNARTFDQVKALVPVGTHLEVAQASAEKNRVYCSKEGAFRITGVMPEQGKRTDISSLYTMARDGASDCDIGDALPGAYLKYYRGVDRVRLNFARQKKKWRNVRVYVYYGKTGTGKTRKCYKKDPDLYSVNHDIGNLWWDGYTNQKSILLDDFYGGINHGLLLRLLDGQPFQLPIKGGQTWKQWKRVFITSNAAPDQWYPGGLSPALARRFRKVREMA